MQHDMGLTISCAVQVVAFLGGWLGRRVHALHVLMGDLVIFFAGGRSGRVLKRRTAWITEWRMVSQCINSV